MACSPCGNIAAVENMEKNRISKTIYVRESISSHSVDKSWKRKIDTLKECLKKKVLDVRCKIGVNGRGL